MLRATHGKAKKLLKALGRCLSVALVLLAFTPVVADDSIAVVYPVTREPFSSVYRDFVTGIKQSYSGTVIEYPVNGLLSVSLPSGADGETSPKAYIALGNKSLKAVAGLDSNIPVFAAFTPAQSSPKIQGGIRLEANAEIYLSRLLEIFPQTKKVHVVYNPKKHQLLIDEASEYLQKMGVPFNAVEATVIRESALGFREIVQSARKGEAIWLISDAGLIDGSLLSLVLDAAWDKRLVVFSSNPLFVKRGALFAIYPDNVAIGLRLGEMVNGFLKNGQTRENIEPLRDVNIAYNERTGNHIGVNLTEKVQGNIQLFLPEM